MSQTRPSLKELSLIDDGEIASTIYEIRGVKVILDEDLAKLYHVATKSLNLAVKRNIKRFSNDFRFQLTQEEYKILRLQNETSRWGGRRYMPFAYTEHGVLMAASILNSDIAIEINKKIIKVFVQLRKQVFNNSEFVMLKEQVKRIEAEQEALQLNQRIDNKVLCDKMTSLSREVNRMSKILDDFQDTHLIIKRIDGNEPPAQG